MYINRRIEYILKKAVQQFPSVIVTGPRQSGKTTLLKHCFGKTHNYITMDNPELRIMAINDPGLLFLNYSSPLIIDEIQYAPNLFSHIKLLIEADRSLNGQFLLTGSQSFPLMHGVSESLAGRIAVLSLLTFSLNESFDLAKELNFEMIKKRTLRGGFPELVVQEEKDLNLWFAGYIQTYLERDVRQLRKIGDLADFQRFMYLIAGYNGQIVNLSNISKDLGVTVNTVKEWLSILTTSNQIMLVKPYYHNRGKRIIKSPRLYWLDTGLLCYFLGISDVEQVFKGPFAGSLMETLVFEELVRYFHNQGKVPTIYWWRTSNGEEVDFIVEENGKLMPIEVKLSSNIKPIMTKDLFSFCTLFADSIEKGYLVSFFEQALKLHESITAIPFLDFVNMLSR